MEVRPTIFPDDTSAAMKISKRAALRAIGIRPTLRFEEQALTSFSGLVLFQALFAELGLVRRLRRCFRHRPSTAIYPLHRIVLLLVVHLLLGFRCVRESRLYAADPMIKRVLGLVRLPDVATVSRALSSLDNKSVERLEALRTDLVLERIAVLPDTRITLDFDGSVIGTGRRAEGTAVGFNKVKKGQRSYYPLYATVAQTRQVLSVLNRSGNVHDSNGARAFIGQCIEQVRAVRPGKRAIEVRMDSAFYSDEILSELEAMGVPYTVSVPFERFVALKDMLGEHTGHWHDIDEDRDAFERRWQPPSWPVKRRFVFVRQHAAVQRREPLQLDLFEPRDYRFEYKVVVTNKRDPIADLVLCHEGRGAQEGLFAELKSENALAYVPSNTWLGNRAYMSAALIAHNLTRELTMRTAAPARTQTIKRSPLWVFPRIATVRRETLQIAGRLIKPQGKLTLSMAANDAVRQRIHGALQYLERVA